MKVFIDKSDVNIVLSVYIIVTSMQHGTQVLVFTYTNIVVKNSYSYVSHRTRLHPLPPPLPLPVSLSLLEWLLGIK